MEENRNEIQNSKLKEMKNKLEKTLKERETAKCKKRKKLPKTAEICGKTGETI